MAGLVGTTQQVYSHRILVFSFSFFVFFCFLFFVDHFTFATVAPPASNITFISYTYTLHHNTTMQLHSELAHFGALSVGNPFQLMLNLGAELLLRVLLVDTARLSLGLHCCLTRPFVLFGLVPWPSDCLAGSYIMIISFFR